MLTVNDVLSDVQRVLGGVDTTEAYSRLNDAVEILANESEWNPLFAYMDVSVSTTGEITLPSQVGTVLAVNVSGKPAHGHDHWFSYHLNGPGDSCHETRDFHWSDKLRVCTINDVPYTGVKLGAVLETATDNNIALRVYGYDTSGNWIRSVEGGNLVDGFLVPTVYGSSDASLTAPDVASIVRITKPVTAGQIWLYQLDVDTGLPTLLVAQYFPTDTEPQYRRIVLNKKSSSTVTVWARVAFRKAVQKLSATTDIIPLHSRYAILHMVKAIRKADEDRPEEYAKYKALAIELLTKKQVSDEVPGGPSIQIAASNLIAPKSGRMDL